MPMNRPCPRWIIPGKTSDGPTATLAHEAGSVLQRRSSRLLKLIVRVKPSVLAFVSIETTAQEI
jgi:hypothetical protein